MEPLQEPQIEIDVNFSELKELINKLLDSQIKSKRKLDIVKNDLKGLGEHNG